MYFYLTRYRKHFIITAVVFSLFWIFLQLRGQGIFSNWSFTDRVIVGITAPVQEWMRDITVGTRTIWSNYVALTQTSKENVTLKQEIGRLQEKIHQLQEIENENDRLRKLLLFSQRLPNRFVPAQVIAENLQGELRTLRLNKGTKDDVKKGAAVLTSAGVVGRVLRVDNHYSDVLTVIDANSAIDALVQRTRARGVVEGLNVSQLTLKYLQREDDVIDGDTVITSGMGGDYPKGIVVGYVVKVERKPYGISQKVMLQPSVDFTKVEEVFIVAGEQP